MHDLESRLAFQEHLIEELNDAVSRQQLVITEMNNAVRLLIDRTRQLIHDGEGERPAADSKPPHY